LFSQPARSAPCQNSTPPPGGASSAEGEEEEPLTLSITARHRLAAITTGEFEDRVRDLRPRRRVKAGGGRFGDRVGGLRRRRRVKVGEGQFVPCWIRRKRVRDVIGSASRRHPI